MRSSPIGLGLLLHQIGKGVPTACQKIALVQFAKARCIPDARRDQAVVDALGKTAIGSIDQLVNTGIGLRHFWRRVEHVPDIVLHAVAQPVETV